MQVLTLICYICAVLCCVPVCCQPPTNQTPKQNDYLKRALELVRRKIKNESVENRESILALWCGDVSRSDRAGRQNLLGAEFDQYHKSWTESGRLVSLELLPLWSQMLEDALESQDLDLNTGDRTPKMINNNKDMDYSHLVLTYYAFTSHHTRVRCVYRSSGFILICLFGGV
jgi:hypothetical protein